jgi:hypothetical protein
MITTPRLPVLAALGLTVLLFAACVPSVNPFYTDKDIVSDPALAGVWSDADGGDKPDTWTFAPAEKPDKSGYTLTLSEESGKRTGKFKAVLFKLGAERFLDLEPIQVDLAETQAGLTKAALIPGHLLLRVYQIGPELRIVITSPDWCDKYLDAHPDALAHRREHDPDALFFTATTAELQKFVLAHLGDDELFAKEADSTKLVRRPPAKADKAADKTADKTPLSPAK